MPNMEKETHFVMRNGKAEYPSVAQENLLVWYDAKGKHNPDRHKDTLLDLSGNNRHAQLYNFAYEKKSGYLDTPEGGLLFDDVDDKLVYPSAKDEVEYTSASRNLFKYNSNLPYSLSGITFTFNPQADSFSVKGISTVYPYKVIMTIKKDSLKDGFYTVSKNMISGTSKALIRVVGRTTTPVSVFDSTFQIAGGHNELHIEIATSPNQEYDESFNVQLEEGSTATPYTPYVPLPVMTYQYNGNILSYEADGTVKRVDDGKVIERKGINLVRNGNFADGTTGWRPNSLVNLRVEGDELVGEASPISESNAFVARALPFEILYTSGHKYYFGVDRRHNNAFVPTNFRIRLAFGDASFIGGADQLFGEGYGKIIECSTSGSSGAYVGYFMTVMKNYKGFTSYFKNIQLIDLTEAYGAGNEPTLEYIQAHPEEFAWTPNPNDLIEAHEIKNNLVGDLEDLHETGDKTEILSGVGEVFTDQADDDSVVHVEIDGKSVGGGSGKNLVTLFNTEAYSSSTNVKIESDKKVSLTSAHGNPASTMLKPKSPAFRRAEAGEYTLSFNRVDPNTSVRSVILVKKSNGDNIVSGVSGHGLYNTAYEGFYFDGYGSDGGTVKRTFTLPPETHTVAVALQVTHAGDATTPPRTNIVYDVQLEKGSIATSYELPAPSPDYPIAIHNLNDFDVVSSVGKRNLLRDSQKIILSPNNTGLGTATLMTDEYAPYYRVVGDNTISMYGPDGSATSNVFTEPMIDGNTYTVSVDIRAPKAGIISNFTWNKNFTVSKANEWVRISCTYTYTGTSFRALGIVFNSNTLDYRNWKIEKGTNDTPWTPAPEDITENDTHPLINKTNILLSEPLRSVGNVKDRLFRDSDGLWKIERNVHSITFKDTTGEKWYFSANSTESRANPEFDLVRNGYPKAVGSITSVEISSTHFLMGKASIPRNYEGRISTGTYLMFSVPKTKYPDVNSWKNMLNQNNSKGTPVTVQYQVETPTIETLDQELQDKLNNIRSFQDSNYLYTIVDKTNILPIYVRDNLKPNLNAKFRKLSWFWSRLLFNQLKIWKRNLTDSELLHEWRQNKKRWGM